MRIKICGIQNEQELHTAVAAGADAVGFHVGQVHQSRSFILPSTAARLVRELPVCVTPVLVTHYFDADEIRDLVDRTGITTIQLHNSSPEEAAALRDLLPVSGKIILARYLRPGRYDWALDDYLPLIDAVSLDAYNLDVARIETDSADKMYQWAMAAEFIASCPKTVLLAGGLSAENVGQAIGITRPVGVDGCRLLQDPETGECAPEKCNAFVRNAREADFLL